MPKKSIKMSKIFRSPIPQEENESGNGVKSQRAVAQRVSERQAPGKLVKQIESGDILY